MKRQYILKFMQNIGHNFIKICSKQSNLLNLKQDFHTCYELCSLKIEPHHASARKTVKLALLSGGFGEFHDTGCGPGAGC